MLLLVWLCRFEWKGHITTVKLHWPPHLCKQGWIQQTNAWLQVGGNSWGSYLSCIWHSAMGHQPVCSLFRDKILWVNFNYWLKNANWHLCKSTMVLQVLNQWFDHIFRQFFEFSVYLCWGYSIHVVSQNAFQVVLNIWWARWRPAITACQPSIGWMSLLERPRLIVIYAIIIPHTQRDTVVGLCFCLFVILSTHLNCNGLLKVKCAFLLWISIFFYFLFFIFLMVALKKPRDALCVSFPRRSRHPLLRSQLKEEKKKNTSKSSFPFSIISNKGGPTGKGT